MKRKKFSIKRALALAMTAIMCAGAVPVTALASEHKYQDAYGLYVPLYKGLTPLNYRGAANVAQLDPAGMEWQKVHDTVDAGDVCYGNVIWLKPTANDLQFTYGKYLSSGHYEGTIANSSFFDFTRKYGTGSVSQSTSKVTLGSIAQTTYFTKFSGLSNGTMFWAKKNSGINSGLNYVFLVGNMNHWIPDFYVDGKDVGNKLTIKKGETVTVTMKYGGSYFTPSGHLTNGTKGKVSMTQNGNTFTLKGLSAGTSKITCVNYLEDSLYPVAPDEILTVTVDDGNKPPTVTDVKIGAGRKVTVTATDSDGTVVKYGYATLTYPDNIVWKDSNVFTTTQFNDYYFYAKDNGGAISPRYKATVYDVPAVTKIAVNGQETEYTVDDPFKDQGIVILYYSNGTTQSVPLTSSMVSGFTTTTPGTKKLTVTCEEKSTTYDINVSPKPQVTEITVSGQKTAYIVGEPFKDQGTVTVYYSDGATKDVPLTSDLISGFSTAVKGTKRVTVTCEGERTTYFINVSPKTYVVTIKAVGANLADRVFNAMSDTTDHAKWNLPEPEKVEGKEFKGYSLSSGGTDLLPAGTEVSLIEDTTYYAIYEDEKPVPTVTEITVSGQEIEYTVGDPFKDQGTVTLHYSDGTTKDVPLTSELVGGFNTATLGTKPLTVTLDGKTVDYDINVNPKTFVATIESIGADLVDRIFNATSNTTDPARWTLPEPEEAAGKEFKGYSLSPSGTDLMPAGTEVSMSENTTYYAIYEDAKPILEFISVDGQETEYLVGDPFAEKGIVTLHFSDGTTQEVPLEESMLGGFDTSTEGTVPVTVTHEGKTTGYDITVKKPSPTIIGITVNNPETEYEVGDDFKPGGTVTIEYDDGTTKDLPLTEDMLSGFNTSQSGKVPVTVTVDGVSVDYTIDVAQKAESITVSGEKTEYAVDDPFVEQGTVTVRYPDGTEEDAPLTEDMISGFDTSAPGVVTVTVTLGDLTTTFDVNVVAKVPSVESITVSGEVTDYFVGDSFVKQGTVTIHYDDGSTKEVPLAETMLKDFDTSVPGVVTVTVECAGMTTTYDINVEEDVAPVLESIDVVGAVTLYPVDSDFAERGTVKLYYSDESMRSIKLKENLVSGFDTTEVGNVPLTVSVDGVSTDYDIEVVEEADDPAEVTIDSIEVVDQVTEYPVGGEFVEQGTVIIRYSDGSEDEVSLTEDMISGFDTSAEGDVTVTVEVDGETVDYVISVKDDGAEDPEEYVVTLDANGVAGVETQTYTVEVGEWEFPAAPVVEGKVFKGYSASSSGSAGLYAEGDMIIVDGDVTFYFIYADGNDGDDNGDGNPSDKPDDGNGNPGEKPDDGSGDGNPSDKPSDGSGDGNKPDDGNGDSNSHPSYPSRPSRPGGGGSSKRPAASKPAESVVEIAEAETPKAAAPGIDNEGNKFELNAGISVTNLGDRGYIYGYPDDTFKAKASITRAEFAAILYRVFDFTDKTVTVKFKDVAENAWYANAVEVLASRGIISGVGDGKFAPDANITVEEAILMLSRIVVLDGYSAETDNSSILASKVSKFLAQAVNSGIAEIAKNSDMKSQISREQTVTFVNSIVYESLETNKTNQFVDVSSSMPTFADIVKASIPATNK